MAKLSYQILREDIHRESLVFYMGRVGFSEVTTGTDTCTVM